MRETFDGVKGVADGFADAPCVRDSHYDLRRSEEDGGEEKEKSMCGRFQFLCGLFYIITKNGASVFKCHLFGYGPNFPRLW